ncbi:ladderlectin-like [Pseudochaenichthys georgianus]|uniref:ladderlectin-like n=1 Tax=Pseudochaenichthys georgianus TaxID=52239 RepID=UPI00146A4C63|nr:ladderlectin-like [Pseudochaenichthys georgianus]
MKTVVVLSVLLCSAFAAPAEHSEKAPEAAVAALKEQMVPAPEMEAEMKKVQEEFVPEDSVPVPRDAPVLEAEAAPESHFNYCPDGWYSHNSRCFIVSNTVSNWFNAEEHCTGLGAHLASATNPREYAFLQEITKRSGLSSAWLGGFSLQSRWMWIDSQGLYYTNWYSQASPSSYPCMYLSTGYGWCNTQCTTSRRFICSKNPFTC